MNLTSLIKENYTWIFSGLGIFILTIIIKLFVKKVGILILSRIIQKVSKLKEILLLMKRKQMKNNIIKENSVGIQAGRDLTVNKTVNELPDSIQNMFVELLRPSIEQIGKNLQNDISTNVSQSISKKIRTVLEEGFLKSLKEQIKSQNLNFHIGVVLERIHKNDTNSHRSKQSINKTIEKTDLFMGWIEGAENVSPEDDVFSTIWQNWLYKLSQGEDNSKQKI